MTHNIHDIARQNRQTGSPMLLILLLIFGGGLFIAKLLNAHPMLEMIPTIVLEWISAIGSFIGGLYMLYKKLYHTRIYV
ncbi:MAG: hypothetical protein V1859_11660 [archaeon]